MKSLFLLLSVHLGCVFCFAQSGEQSYAGYRQKILAIQQKAGHLVAADDLFADTNFIAFYEHPVDCASNAALFLRGPENPEFAKMIVVYSSQRLPLQLYVEFEGRLIEMAESRQISSNLLNRAIFPGLEWSTKIQKDFANHEVKALIDKIKKCPQINSNNREYLKEIASGKARDDARDMEEAGMLRAHAAQN